MSPGTSVIRISALLDKRLAFLAGATGRSKSYYASKAIEAYLDAREALHLDVAALENAPRRQSVESMRKQLAARAIALRTEK